MNYDINNFIKEESLREHIRNTLLDYIKTFKSYNLTKFNKNLVDPIKLNFDMVVFGKTLEEVIESEITRQLDKSLNNKIGYFHQNLFNFVVDKNWKSMKNGEVWDLENTTEHIFVEMKNKHNTMNSSSKQSTYLKMIDLVAKNSNNKAYLVEVISKKSQDIEWCYSQKYNKNENIRLLSIDKFTDKIANDNGVFYRFTKILPILIKEEFDKLSEENHFIPRVANSVFYELEILSKKLNKSPLETLYYLAFKDYTGFFVKN